MITLTEIAANEVKRIIEEMNEGTKYLRVAVKGGGCSGFQYALNLDDQKTEKDDTSEQHGVQIVVDKRSAMYLGGVKVDFHQDVMRRGFVFDNPNATGKCGCGSSFSV